MYMCHVCGCLLVLFDCDCQSVCWFVCLLYMMMFSLLFSRMKVGMPGCLDESESTMTVGLANYSKEQHQGSKWKKYPKLFA